MYGYYSTEVMTGEDLLVAGRRLNTARQRRAVRGVIRRMARHHGTATAWAIVRTWPDQDAEYRAGSADAHARFNASRSNG